MLTTEGQTNAASIPNVCIPVPEIIGRIWKKGGYICKILEDFWEASGKFSVKAHPLRFLREDTNFFALWNVMEFGKISGFPWSKLDPKFLSNFGSSSGFLTRVDHSFTIAWNPLVLSVAYLRDSWALLLFFFLGNVASGAIIHLRKENIPTNLEKQSECLQVRDVFPSLLLFVSFQDNTTS